MKKLFLIGLATSMLGFGLETKTLLNINYGKENIRADVDTNDKGIKKVERSYGNLLSAGVDFTILNSINPGDDIEFKYGAGLGIGYGRIVKMHDDERKGTVEKNMNAYKEMKNLYEELKKDPEATEKDIKEAEEIVKQMEAKGQDAHFYSTQVTPHATMELSKKVNTDMKVYIGVNLGKTFYYSKYFKEDRSVLGRNTSFKKYGQSNFDVKGYLGVSYKNFVAELSTGNNNYVNLGLGARF